MASQISTFVLVSIFAVVTVYGTAPITNEVESSGIAIDNRNGGSSDPNKPLKLVNEVNPEQYKITITLEKGFETTHKFKGTLTINVKSKQGTSKDITLHSAGLDIKTKKFSLKNKNVPNEELLDQNQQSDDESHQTVTLKFASGKTMTKNIVHELSIDYTGDLQGDMRGLYINKYKNRDDVDEIALATHLHPTHARKLFPCFDEPATKSIFEVTLVYPESYNALFNTPTKDRTSPSEGMVTHTFEVTPKMSTYLLGIVISKFDYTETKDPINGIPHRVWSRYQGEFDQSGYGLMQSRKLLNVIQEFTNDKFKEQSIEKVDHVALTDFSAGAMENWGLVTYREALFLYNRYESSAKDKQRICSIIAHELSHFWFGNLLTTEWWDNAWLHEGFARYFEYMAAHEVEPDMELDKQFVIEQHLAILNADSLPSSKPLDSEPKSNTEIAAKFNSITYNKGASIIRMMSNWMTKEQFQTNLVQYIRDNKKGTVTPADLWQAMTDNKNLLPETLANVMNSYVTQEGLPLLKVKLNQREVTIEQGGRFGFNLKTPQDIRYYVPISYTANEKDNPKLDFEDTKPKCWITKDKDSKCGPITLESDNAVIIVNIRASAYARVNYDDALWDRIITTLNSPNFGGIDEITRAQIVDDAINLARAGIIPYERGLKIVEYLEKETSYYPWYAALNGFQYLLRRLPPKDTEYLKKYILYLMESINDNDEYEKVHIEALKLALEKSWKCELGDKECIAEMKDLFLNQRVKIIDPDVRNTAYCVGIRYTTNLYWKVFFRRYKTATSPSQARLILKALGCIRNDEVRKEYLMMIVDIDSDIRDQDVNLVFSSVVNGNADGVDLAAEFVIKNCVQLDKRFSNTDILTDMMTDLIDRFTSKDQTKKFREDLNGLDPEPSFKSDAIKLLQEADIDIEWSIANKYKINESVMKYLNKQVPKTTTPKPKPTPKPTQKTTSKPNGANVGSNVASILLVACNLYLVSFVRQ